MQILEVKTCKTKKIEKMSSTKTGTCLMCPENITDTRMDRAEQLNRMEQRMLGAERSFCSNPGEHDGDKYQGGSRGASEKNKQ